MYKVEVYPERNHLFVKIGSMELQESETLIDEMFSAIEQLEPGWSVITDLSEAVPADASHGDLIGPVMKKMADAGLGKAIRVVGNARMMPKLWEKLSSTEGGYSAAVVTTLEEAEELLDTWSSPDSP